MQYEEMVLIRRRWISALAFLAALLIGGCATPGAKRSDGSVTLDLAARDGEGFVALRIVNTSPLSFLHSKWKVATVRSKAGGKSFDLLDLANAMDYLARGGDARQFIGGGTSIYFARLPVGEYELVDLRSDVPGNAAMPISMIVGGLLSNRQTMASMPSFTVESRGLANLGTLVYAPGIEGVRPPNMALLRGDIGRNAVREDLGDETSGVVLPPERGGWSSSPPSAEEETRVLAGTRSWVSSLSLRSDDDLSAPVAWGAALGSIITRDGSGRWGLEFLPTLSHITYLRRLHDGTLIAGGGYGRYFVKHSGGAWIAHQLLAKKGTVAYVEVLPGGKVLFVTSDEGFAYGFVLNELEGAQTSALPPIEGNPFMVMSRKDVIVIPRNHTGLLRQVSLTSIDKKTFATNSTTEGFWISDLQRSSNGALYMTRQNGVSLYQSRSPDGGATWIHDQQPGVWRAHFVEGALAYGFALDKGLTSVTSLLQKTTDGGRSWQRIGTPLQNQPAAARFAYADRSELLVQSGALVLSSRNEGATWEQVLPVRRPEGQ